MGLGCASGVLAGVSPIIADERGISPDNVVIDSGSTRRQLGHRNPKRVGILLAGMCQFLRGGGGNYHDRQRLLSFKDPGPGFGGDTPGETRDFYLPPSGQYIDKAFKRWRSNAESMLLFVRLSVRTHRFLGA
jgi:hypothetical protein